MNLSSSSVRRVVLLAALFSVWCAIAPAHAADDPTLGWQQRLSQVESQLRKLPANDAAGRERLAADLTQLRQDIGGWLEAYPPAKADSQTWLEKGGSLASVEELAGEVSRLRATIQRVKASLQGSDAGSFYLGRVDVAVNAETTTTATTEMTPAGATLIDAQDLRANDRSALAGALALAPGVSFVRIGQRNETQVYVRGFDMRQVPLFVDGVPVYTPYDGYVDLERFTTFDVSEVQVSKGFTSVLQGPNALGGAINIISRRPNAKVEGVVGASYASGTSKTTYANVGSRLDKFYVQAGGSYLESDTFPLSDDFKAVSTQPAGDRVNAYKRDGKFNVKLGWTPRGDEYAISYVGQRGKKGNPPYAGSDTSVKVRFWQWPNWDKDSVYFVSNTHLGSNSYLRARAFRDVYDNTLYAYDDATYTTQKKSSSFQSPYHDTTTGGSLEWGLTIGSKQTVRAAGHYKNDKHQDHNVGEPVKHFDGRIYSGGLEYTLTPISRLSLVAGVSGDKQTTTLAQDYQKGQVLDLIASCKASGSGSCGDTSGVNPQVGAFLSVPTGQLRLTLARKTRLPSLKDRYSYKMGQAQPNPDLKAEHNNTIEAGYQGTLGAKTSFMASVFYSRIEDMIQKFYLSSSLYQLRNIGKASSAGLELDARTQLVPHVDLGANYTYLHRKNISDPSVELVDAPKHKGRVSLTGTITPSLRLVGGVDYEKGRRTLNEGGKYLSVPSFAVVSLKGIYTIARHVDIEAAMMNAFDKNYWVADGYPEAGRTGLATVRWRF